MISKVKSISPIYFLLALFFLFKLNHLHLPYFWDELGVYSRAALYMFDHQISLMPDAIPPELSRGHPLLCTVIFAIGYRIFGPHVWAGHLTALLWSCGLLYLLYRFVRDFFDQKTALLASALLAVQPVFIAQSSMVLPEIILAFFCTASLYAYLKDNFVQAALFSSLAIFTKETAIVLPVSLGIHLLFTILRNRVSKKSLNELILISSPLFAWGIFLCIQKIQNGWFFFPLHADYISFSTAEVLAKLRYYINFLFVQQGRYLWTALFLYASYKTTLDKKATLFIHLISEKQKLLLVIIIFASVSFFVSILNFHLARYVLFIIPALCAIVSAQTIHLLKNNRLLFFQFFVAIFLSIPFFYYKGNIFNVDADMGYIDIVNAQREITSLLNTSTDENSVIAADFPVYHGLIEKRAGYSKIAYKTVVWGCSEKARKADYLVFSFPGNLSNCTRDEENMTLLKKIKGKFWRIYLYKR